MLSWAGCTRSLSFYSVVGNLLQVLYRAITTPVKDAKKSRCCLFSIQSLLAGRFRYCNSAGSVQCKICVLSAIHSVPSVLGAAPRPQLCQAGAPPKKSKKAARRADRLNTHSKGREYKGTYSLRLATKQNFFFVCRVRRSSLENQ